jgi:hypothetical protein
MQQKPYGRSPRLFPPDDLPDSLPQRSLLAITKRRRVFTPVWLIPLLIATFLLFPAGASDASAHTLTAQANSGSGPRFSVSAGFDTRYRDGNWVPVVVSLSNSGSDFNGTLSITATPSFNNTADSSTISNYQQPVNLANGAQKQITMYIPLSTGASGTTQNITINLLNSNGQTVSKQTSTLNAIGTGDIFVGVLSDQTTGFAPLNAVPLPNQGGAMIVEHLSATTMPALAEVLENFDVIVLDNYTTSNLSQAQLNALDTWVNQGGTLIEVGGPEWHRTLSPLPSDLLPVSITGTATVPTGTSLLPVGGPDRGGVDAQGTVPTSVQAPVAISTASVAPGAKAMPLLSAGKTPLIVRAQRGEGTVSYLAFDPTLEPVAGWPGASMLWEGLLLRNLGDQLLSSANNPGVLPPKGQFIVSGMSGLLQTLMPNTLPSPWLLLILLVGYLVILGPVRLIIVRWRNKRNWSWRIVLASVVVFSLLTYGLALQEKGTAILSDSISVVRLNASGGSAHETTYLGVFVPNQGDFQVHMSGDVLAQPSPNDFNSGVSGKQQTTFSPTSDGTNVDLQGVDIWTLRSILAERDRPVHGGIVSHLSMVNGTLKGTVTNTLTYSLSDVYVLMTNSFAHIGHLGAGQTIQVNTAMNTSNNAGMPLATQIALSANGGQQYYGPYYNSNNGQPLTETQRHLAILTALSGQGYGSFGMPPCGGGPCKVVPVAPVMQSSGSAFGYASYSSVSVTLSGGGSLIAYGSDPLLVPGAPATLIGWADSPTGNSAVTINGATPSGLSETLVQTPLDLTFSGALNLPLNYVSGQLVDVQSKSNNVQLQAPGIYVLATGSMTFEFVLPTSHLQVSNMTIAEPSTLQQMVPTGGSGGPTDVNHMHVFLYNWQAKSWDAYTMQNYSFSVDNTAPYIGPNGRVLVQFLNTDSTLGSVLLAKPSLDVQGSAS